MGEWLMAESPQPSAISHGQALDFGHVAGLRALRTVDDLELHCLAFLERTEAVALNGLVVHEDVTASVALDESVTLGVVEPLDLACDAHRSSSLLAGRSALRLALLSCLSKPPPPSVRLARCRRSRDEGGADEL